MHIEHNITIIDLQNPNCVIHMNYGQRKVYIYPMDGNSYKHE